MGFQIAPMIDVVFVILLYFMVMAGAVQVENAHNTKLPGTVASETETETPDEVAIKIEDDGQVYLNDDPLDSPEACTGTSCSFPSLRRPRLLLRRGDRDAGKRGAWRGLRGCRPARTAQQRSRQDRDGCRCDNA